MTVDAAVHRILVAGFTIVIPIALYFRIKSQATREKLDRRQEGVFILATLRPVGVLLWGGAIAYLINPANMAWSSVPLPAGLRWTGVGVFAAALTVMLWTLSSLGPNLTDTVVTRKAQSLVT